MALEVDAHGESPQHATGIDEPGARGHTAGGAVGADDHVGAGSSRRRRARRSGAPPGPAAVATPRTRARHGPRPGLHRIVGQPGVEGPARDGDAVAGVGRAPRSRAGAGAAPRGPPPPCRRACVVPGSRARPSSASNAMARGPTASPQALSRGKAALSISATRAPPRARTSAATLPAGPDPTTATSKCSPATVSSPIEGRSVGLSHRAPRDTDHRRPQQPVRPAPVHRAARSLRPAGGAALDGPERSLAPGHGGPRGGGRTPGASSTWPPAPPGWPCSWRDAPARTSSGWTSPKP